MQRELKKRGWGHRRLARELAEVGTVTSDASIWRYLNGKREPPYSLMVALEDLLGVPTKLWLRRAA